MYGSVLFVLSLFLTLSVCLYTVKIITTGRKRTGVRCAGSKLLGHWGLTKGWALITSYIWHGREQSLEHVTRAGMQGLADGKHF